MGAFGTKYRVYTVISTVVMIMMNEERLSVYHVIYYSTIHTRATYINGKYNLYFDWKKDQSNSIIGVTVSWSIPYKVTIRYSTVFTWSRTSNLWSESVGWIQFGMIPNLMLSGWFTLDRHEFAYFWHSSLVFLCRDGRSIVEK